MKTSIKYHINRILFHPTGLASRIVDGIFAFLIILSTSTLPFHFIPYFDFIEQELWYFEMFVVSFFTIEYLLRVWVTEYKLKYIFSLYGAIDIIAILPFFLEELHIIPHEFIFLVFIRILRILRIIKLVKMYNIEREEISKQSKNGHGTFQTMQGEKIIKIVHKHSFVFLFSLFSVILFSFLGLATFFVFPLHTTTITVGVLFFILSIVSFFKNWLDFHYDAIYVTNYRIVIQNRHIFGMERNEIPYRAITHIHPNTKGFLKMIFNYGDISIETAGKSIDTKFPYVPMVDHIVRIITRKIEESRHNTTVPHIPVSQEVQTTQPSTKFPDQPYKADLYSPPILSPRIFDNIRFNGIRQKSNINIYKLLQHQRHI